MKNLLLFCCLLLLLAGCQPSTNSNSKTTSVTSPSGNNQIEFQLSSDGQPGYLVKHNSKIIIDSSLMGFDFKTQKGFINNFKIKNTSTETQKETWEMPWGEQRSVLNHYSQLKVELEESAPPHRPWNIYFRAYDDGVAFRYEFPKQEGVDTLFILDEKTQFQLTGDPTCWWIPGDWDIYEHLYSTTKFSEINAVSKANHPNLAQTHIPENSVNTPMTMKADDGLHLSFHEANLTDYAGMTLKTDTKNLLMTSSLVGSNIRDYKVKRALPFKTPWRTIQIADQAKDLIASKLIVNLNEPNKLGDVSWFKPKKYVGIWWEMHIDVARWDYGVREENAPKQAVPPKPHGKHGATTENAMRYIDFAAKNNIGGVLVEGWNRGWELWIGFDDREDVFDFVTPYPDYDLKKVADYAKSKGVEMIMHHETSSTPRTYSKQLDTAYALMKSLGMHSVKTGYVGPIIPKGEYHHGQWMVNHYRKVLETAAKYQVAINAHEPIKATGIRRTLPNAISREGLRGQEFNAWASDGGNPPEHLPIVAFTRMLSGPIDFTPGAFEMSLKTKPNNQINTTLAQQLALYVVIYSPIQMACDLPQNYENQPAFQFIRDVGVDWEQSIVLDGEVGDFVTIAREERGTGNWFVGSITDENKRTVKINFDFLPEGKTFKAKIYKDGANAHYKTNPLDIIIEEENIDKNTIKEFVLGEGGGLAISLVE